MQIINTGIDGMLIIEPEVFQDARGWFVESYSETKLYNLGIKDKFIQDNHSFSYKKNTLRGIHFQAYPKAQTKLLRCTYGKVLDVVVDIRIDSPTYLKVEKVELSRDNFRQLYMPKGLAHAILSLTDQSEIQYKVDEEFLPEYELGIRYNDPQLNIDWETEELILSDKDKNLPYLCSIEKKYLYRYQEKE
ncbi:dTDP-4-dehydrorhamnose 3,5-epimerase [Cellulosilyticum sp. ST5]|uniref:dTDP-4-dehydrorhamnose 3,5-epimerase n=1 Tax=unclassified Cellulosilyticum TaxID=2643091 RepID=UPI000F8D6B83|nr:dTDP-4-dehydrorhamnose 3,5-epimerase [Cellulosilyticum sp. WCF-2]QEH66976.1 dTDP-4-dehydrorhamnose 3,5-epimerase [Cellulosilyticum sp. WCF-2]